MQNTILIMFLVLSFSCDTVKPLKILTLGDSNGAAKHGWVNQLKALMPHDSIYNKSISGNTIGFDNLNNPKLNTLANLDRYLLEADQKAKGIDYVVVMLGTNDSKAVFDARSVEVLENLRTLIGRIRDFEYSHRSVPELVVLSPPPYGPDSILADKYRGGAARVKWLSEQYKTICQSAGVTFVGIHSLLENQFMDYSEDGVHLDSIGQLLIANEVRRSLTSNN